MRPRESFEGSRGPLPTLFNPRFCPTIGVHLTLPSFQRRHARFYSVGRQLLAELPPSGWQGRGEIDRQRSGLSVIADSYHEIVDGHNVRRRTSSSAWQMARRPTAFPAQ